MERVAGGVSSGMRTVAFVVIASTIILGWIFADGAAHYVTEMVSRIGHGKEFDPEPWILLNLIFSGVAFYTGHRATCGPGEVAR